MILSDYIFYKFKTFSSTECEPIKIGDSFEYENNAMIVKKISA